MVQREGPSLIYHTCQLNFLGCVVNTQRLRCCFRCCDFDQVLCQRSGHRVTSGHGERLTVDGGFLYVAKDMRKKKMEDYYDKGSYW